MKLIRRIFFWGALLPALLSVLLINFGAISYSQDAPLPASVRLNYLQADVVISELKKLFPLEFTVSDSMTVSYEAEPGMDEKIIEAIRQIDIEPRKTIRLNHDNPAAVKQMLEQRFEDVTVSINGGSSFLVTGYLGQMNDITEFVRKYEIATITAAKTAAETAPAPVHTSENPAVKEDEETDGKAPVQDSLSDKMSDETPSPISGNKPEPQADKIKSIPPAQSSARRWINLRVAKPARIRYAIWLHHGISLVEDEPGGRVGIPRTVADPAAILDEIAAWDTDAISTRRLSVKYLEAKDVLSVIKDRTKIKDSVVDSVNNSLILSGPANELLNALYIIATIDLAMPSYRDGVSSKDPQITSIVYQLSNVSAAEVADIIKGSYTSQDKSATSDIDALRNRLIVTASAHMHDRIADLITQYDVPDMTGGRVWGTEAIPVYYRNLKEAEQIIETHFKPVKVSIDNNARRLIVSGSNALIQEIRRFAKMWDDRPPTVLVEGTIIQVNHNKINEVGAKLEHTFSRSDVKSNDRTMTTAVTAKSDFTTSALQSIVYEWQSPDGRLYRATLGALISEGAIDISVKPLITFISGGTGSFEQKQKIPQVTSSDRGTNVNFSSAGVALKVGGIAVPTRSGGSEDDPAYQIILNTLELEDGRVGAQVAAANAVAFFSSEILFKSPQIVNDGELIVVGGSMERNITKTLSRVPILGDIPILRIFFRYNKEDQRVIETMALLRISVVREKSYEYKAAQFTASKPLRPIEFGGNIKDSISEHPLKTSTWSSEIVYKDGGGYFEWIHDRFNYDQMKKIEREFKIKIRGRIKLTQEWSDLDLVAKLILTDKGLKDAYIAIGQEHDISPYEVLIIARHIGSIDDDVFLIYKRFLEQNQLLMMAHKQSTKPMPLDLRSK